MLPDQLTNIPGQGLIALATLLNNGGADHMTTKRTLLRTVGTVIAATSLAGCERRGDRTPSGGPVTDGGETRSTDSRDAGVEAVSIEAKEGSCGETATAEITQTDNGIAVSGTVVSPTPCYIARLDVSRVEGDSATFRIGVEEDPAVDACVECIGTVPFDLSATLGPAIETVVIEIAGNDPRTIEKRLR